jgi:hypothetical protein
MQTIFFCSCTERQSPISGQLVHQRPSFHHSNDFFLREIAAVPYDILRWYAISSTRKLIDRIFIDLNIRRPYEYGEYSSTRTFIDLNICQLEYLSTRIFVNLNICQPEYLSTRTFTDPNICQPEYLSTQILVNPNIRRPTVKVRKFVDLCEICSTILPYIT